MRHPLYNYAALDDFFGASEGTTQAIGDETEEVFPAPEKRTFPVDSPGDYATAWGSSIHYQRYLYALIRLAKPRVVVETGVDWGVSTRLILAALRRNAEWSSDRYGVLYSIDPTYADKEDAQRTIESRLGPLDHAEHWFYESDVSTEALPRIQAREPVWDLFVHDSDHGIYAQTYEYAFGWDRLCVGGFLVSDDYTWGRPPHGAWPKFCAREELIYRTIGNAAVVRKLDSTTPRFQGLQYLELAQSAEDSYVGSDNRYSKVKGGK